MLENILTVMGGALGLLVPALFVIVLARGIARTPFDAAKKAQLKWRLIGGVAVWTAAVWAAALSGVISYHTGDAFPRVLIPVFIPFAIGLALLRNQDFRTILNHTTVASLVGVQTFRLAGFALLLVANLGILPSVFGSGGYGDIATGTLALTAGLALAKRSSGSSALFWAFNLVGVLDILNVSFWLLARYPSFTNAVPSSAPLADFSLVMIPAIAVPVALLLHTYSVRGFLAKRVAVDARAPSQTAVGA